MFELLPIVLAQYTWLGVWLASALLAGLALQSVLLDFRSGVSAWPNAELAMFFSLSGGLALQIALLIVLALLGQLNPIAVLLSSTAMAICSLWLLWNRPGCLQSLRSVFQRPWEEWLAMVPVVLIIAAWLVRPLGAAEGSDPLAYHLPYARFYLEQGGLAVNETLRFPLHTHNVNLLYAVALMRPEAITSPALAQMLHASMGWLSLLGIYGAARAWRSWPTALLAVLGVLLLGEFVFSFSAAFVDNGVMLFITGAVLALTRWQEGQDRGWLWFAAVLAGTAMGTKYLAILFMLPLGLWVLWRSRSLKLSLRFALLVSAVGLFWYVRSWWLVGNPVHPFASEIFGYTLWTAQDLQGQIHELDSHGLAQTWQNLLLLPLKMFTDWYRFNGATGKAGWLVGLFMASCLLLPWQRPALWPIHLWCLAYLVFWFFSSQVIRYLMVMLPLISLCTMMAGAEVLARMKTLISSRLGASRGMPLPVYAKSIPLLLVVLALGYFSMQRFYRDLLWFPLTQEHQHQALLKSQTAYAPAVAAAADSRIAPGPILQIQLPEFRWFFPGTVYGDWMGRYPYRDFGRIGDSGHWEINSGAVLRDQVKAIGAVAVVFLKDPDIQFSPQDLDSYREDFEVILETDKAVLMILR